MADQNKEPTPQEKVDQIKRGVIDDWSDANPPDYGDKQNPDKQRNGGDTR